MRALFSISFTYLNWVWRCKTLMFPAYTLPFNILQRCLHVRQFGDPALSPWPKWALNAAWESLQGYNPPQIYIIFFLFWFRLPVHVLCCLCLPSLKHEMALFRVDWLLGSFSVLGGVRSSEGYRFVRALIFVFSDSYRCSRVLELVFEVQSLHVASLHSTF